MILTHTWFRFWALLKICKSKPTYLWVCSDLTLKSWLHPEPCDPSATLPQPSTPHTIKTRENLVLTGLGQELRISATLLYVWVFGFDGKTLFCQYAAHTVCYQVFSLLKVSVAGIQIYCP